MAGLTGGCNVGKVSQMPVLNHAEENTEKPGYPFPPGEERVIPVHPGFLLIHSRGFTAPDDFAGNIGGVDKIFPEIIEQVAVIRSF